jgi:hypothetical protein
VRSRAKVDWRGLDRIVCSTRQDYGHKREIRQKRDKAKSDHSWHCSSDKKQGEKKEGEVKEGEVKQGET